MNQQHAVVTGAARGIGAAIARALSAAGARVTYSEIDDLSHTYPREINATLLRWLNGE